MSAPNHAPSDPNLIRQHLAGRDEPCPLCRYNLRDLTTPNCPECGSAINIRVALEKPRMALWMATLIGLSAIAGCGTIMTILILFISLMEGEWSSLWWHPIPISCFVAALLGAPAVFLWIRFASRLRQMHIGLRATAAIAIWSFAVGYPIILFYVTTY